MAGRLTPLGFVLKWIVVPVSLGAIGYFLVGPRVEIPKDIEDKVRKVAGNPGTLEADNPEETQAEEDKPEKTFSAPEVDVTVTALNNRPKPKRKKRRRRTTTVQAPSQEQPAPEAPTGDGGGGEPPPAGDGT
jgi:hypothetical protein